MKDLKNAIALLIVIVAVLVMMTFVIILGDFISQFFSEGAAAKIMQILIAGSNTELWTLTGSIVGAVISFMLLILWDKYKDHTYTIRKEKLTLDNIRHEIEFCLGNCHDCKKHLQTEIERFKKGESPLVMPPPIIRLNIWELLRYYLPRQIKGNTELFQDIRKAINLVSYFNYQLNSREEWHIHNKAMGNYLSNLKIYNETLLGDLESFLIPMIGSLYEKLKLNR